MYRNKEELRMFGSDLNKYVNKNCRKDMGVANIDMVQVRENIVRFIESKHWGESSSDFQQRLIRTILYWAFKHLNGSQNLYEFQLYIVTANFPLDDQMALVENILSGERKLFTKEWEFKEFLEFKNEV